MAIRTLPIYASDSTYLALNLWAVCLRMQSERTSGEEYRISSARGAPRFRSAFCEV